MPTPLHTAIRAGDEREALRYVAQGAVVVRVFDDEGNTPLALAAARGQLTLVGTLLDAHAKVNARDAGDKTAAKVLAEAWRLSGLPTLAEREAYCLAAAGHGASLNRTPLACAVREGQYAAAEMMLERGARRDVVDHLGLSPLAIAVERNDADCVRLLIEGRERAGPLSVDAALLDAAFHRPAKVMAALLEGRLGPRARAARLVHAASTLNLDLANALLEKGVSPDARGYCGWSALGAAIASTPSEAAPADSPGALPQVREHERIRLRVLMAHALLDAGASPELPARANETPREVAVRCGAPEEIVERLLSTIPDQNDA